jgi:hypothetical protein
MKKVSLFSFGLAIVLLSSGCQSFRVKTDLLPDADAKLKSQAGTFYIAGLKYDCDDVDRKNKDPRDDTNYGKDLLRLLRKECTSRYPLLFSKEAESAIPLFVRVNSVIERNDAKTRAWLICTLMITPLLLPLPDESDHDLAVSVNVWNDPDGQGGVPVRKKFHREEHSWMSMMPLGLIPIPGESDFPKELFVEWNGGYYNVPQVAQQVATALAKMIESKEPEFWTAAPHRTQQPGYAPTTPVTTPPVQPPPEPITPF